MMRKHLLCLAFAVATLASCGKKEEAPRSAVDTGEEKVLNIYNWPDYIPEGMVADFEKETGIKVNYDTFETNEALHAKLMAGNTGYDIVVPGAVFAKPQIEGGLLQALDKSQLPNLAHLDPEVMKTLSRADPDNRHLVPWAWSFTTVGINRTLARRVLGDAPLPDNAWELVFNPDYTKRLKACGIAFLDSPTEIIPAALHYLGKNPYSGRPDDYRAATQMLAAVRPDIRLFSSTMIDDVAGGKACVVVGWAGDINIAAVRAKENGSEDVIEALLPRTGGLSFFDTMALPKDAKHPGNAHAFINFYLRPDNAARLANEMNYNAGNRAALAQVDPEIARNKTIFLEPADMGRLVPPGSFSNEAREAMASAYNAFKQGK